VAAAGDADLAELLSLNALYNSLAELLRDPGTTAAAVQAWATANAPASVWRARHVLFLATYYEHFAPRRTACQPVLDALAVPAFCTALDINPAELSAYRVVASGLIPDPVPSDDGIRYLFSAAAVADGTR
jgi:hypothetical protein